MAAGRSTFNLPESAKSAAKGSALCNESKYSNSSGLEAVPEWIGKTTCQHTGHVLLVDSGVTMQADPTR